ncbi:MAG: prephenate dehydrogenase/arogenate dehydrogenase family protein [Deltaproteobacteria bacterium]|nr:MAG: prephenate dehydrogenase/arogenate dehydrogenase family protein [Deltaproteobacteria bacterium]
MQERLNKVRNEIDSIDQKLLRLLEERLLLAEEVARIKERQDDVALTDPQREKEIFAKLRQSTGHKVLQAEVENIFSICMGMSKRVRIIRHQQEKNRYLPSLSIGIVGHGHFGALLSQIFQMHWGQSKLRVYAPEQTPDQATFFELADVCQSDLLFLCVPISSMTHVLQTVATLLGEQTTVLDVCSVKMFAVEQMKAILGEERRMIATHPMFGPQSTKQGTDFYDLNMVMHNLSAPAFVYDVVMQFWRNLGVNVVEMTPEDHDRYAAYSINYNHLMGRVGESIGLQTTPIDTKGFRVIYDALQYVTNDTWELFRDMQQHNPFAQEMREKVKVAMAQIEGKLTAPSDE